ncbi:MULTISPECIES: NADH-quinone oxidoreductase subunit NuoN [unclassified Isoptericola]|uniref:NADH-quinone oxidoreductase subunit NuoN n=1 Tax=unclassified Isoptericola TaxID=2623355 RepID=UPI0027128061|nr:MULTISPECIES: NADH-quinone oxidoreductase subunit NuoN [unclassified Isoptericola]MDO8143225.1 NADH-quinone oxidoreductase subunit NuoN [Isoptericola sp. 178]MDO8150599.1 NADH-quinone oxidoreductase subunit NuoN [Isoptericola sp. b408]
MNEFVAPEIDWAVLSPVLVVLAAGVVGVLVEAFVPARARRVVQLVLTLGALAGSLVAVALLWDRVLTDGLAFVVDGTVLLTPFTLGIQAVVALLALLGVLVVADRTSTGQDAFAPTAAAVPGTAYEDAARQAGLQQTEIYPLMLFATGGMLLFPATDNLIVLFIALEVLSLPLYVLCATARRRRLLSQEAAFKYFLLGSFASALMLFGIALVYGATATVSLELAVSRLANPDSPVLTMMPDLVIAAVLLISVGLLFKIGAAPFHTWTPDVYQGAPTPITAFMAACVKAAAIGAMVRVLFTLAAGLDEPLRRDLETGLWVVAILTMLVGTAAGAVQTDVKRMLAYSSIAHAGFLLVAMVGLDEVGAQAVLFYVLAYGLATLGAFAVVTLVREQDADGVVLGEATHLSQWAGLGRRSPLLATAFSLFLLSMAGIPLTAGFLAKFGAFSAAVEAGAWPLAVIGVLASIVAVFFYVRLIVLMVLTPPVEETADDGVTPAGAVAADGTPDDGLRDGEGVEDGPEPARTGTLTAARALAGRAAVVVVASQGPTAVAITVCAVGVVLLGIVPAAVLDWTTQAAAFRPFGP